MRHIAVLIIAFAILTMIVTPPVVFLRVWMGRNEENDRLNMIDGKAMKVTLIICVIGLAIGLLTLGLATVLGLD